MNDAAIKAVYADYRRVKGRKVLQLICEVPLELAPMVHKVFGEPTPDESLWVGIARLDPQSADDETPVRHAKEITDTPQKTAGNSTKNAERESSRKWHEMKPSQQAGIACQDDLFARFLFDEYGVYGNDEVGCADFVRKFCGVKSRSELDTNNTAANTFRMLHNAFEAWKFAPSCGAA